MKTKIILGDLHFGIKRFSTDFLKNQLDFFYKQLLPYMKENNIQEIIQLGDIFDNRVSVDIEFLNSIDNFFQELKDRNITFYTLLGNHDIYYRNSREVSLIELFSKKFDNIILFKEKTEVNFGNSKCLFVPWITKNDSFNKEDIKGYDYIFGHFEIANFQIMKGILDKDSYLTDDFFLEQGIKEVFSGHYHIKSKGNIVRYVGTPYQLNWGDFEDSKGFYVFNDTELKFIENNVSKKFIKIYIYEDTFCIKGYSKEDLYFDIKDFEKKILELKDNFIKIIEKEKNPDVNVLLSKNKLNIKISKEVELNEINLNELDSNKNSELSSVENYILQVIENQDKDLLKYYNNLLQKVKDLDEI